MTLEESLLRPTYEEALSELSDVTKSIRECVSLSLSSKEEVNTSNFMVDKEYGTQLDTKGKRIRKLLGYQAHATYRISFLFDNVSLSRLLSGLSKFDGRLSFSYALSGKEKAKDEVMFWRYKPQ